jgi:hypothetical protein
LYSAIVPVQASSIDAAITLKYFPDQALAITTHIDHAIRHRQRRHSDVPVGQFPDTRAIFTFRGFTPFPDDPMIVIVFCSHHSPRGDQ